MLLAIMISQYTAYQQECSQINLTFRFKADEKAANIINRKSIGLTILAKKCLKVPSFSCKS